MRMQINKVQNKYNPKFTAIKKVCCKGAFCPRAIDSDRKDVEYLYKNRFIKKLAKIWDFDVIFSLKPHFHCSKFHKTFELKGRKPNPLPKYEANAISDLKYRSFIDMIKDVKETVTKYGGKDFKEVLK